jgi:hypothetical protein
MKLPIQRLPAICILACCVAFSAKADLATLTLNPVGGAIFGTPGATIGWGFTVFNATGYMVITSSDYVSGTPLGVYSDYISTYQFMVIGPE